MTTKLERYSLIASDVIKETLEKLKSKIFDGTNDSLAAEDLDGGAEHQTFVKTKLSSSLQCNYINTEKLETVISKNTLPSSLPLQPGFEKLVQLPCKQSLRQQKKQKRIERSKTKGKDWFYMPAAEQTEENLNELKLIQMRGVLAADRFYKRTEGRPGVLPKFFQKGTVVESAADFYSSRIPKKQRKKSLVEELMADAEFQKYRKRKYAEVLSKKGYKNKKIKK